MGAPAKQTILGLEFLRGICAAMVALAHTLHWGGYILLQNWTIFGVSCFFVISGAVIYHNYNKLPALDLFIFKRFARLAPLYVLAMVVTWIGFRHPVDLKLIYNSSMTFGLLNNRCDVAGCWTLGVEMVLYVLFPVLLAFMRSTRMIVAMLLFFLAIRVASLDSIDPVDWWPNYIEPGSFIVLFFGGMAVAHYAPRIDLPKWAWVLGAFVFFAAIFGIPTERQQIFGIEGVALVAACIMLVACFWRINAPLSRFMGEISYGVYLLHPIVWGAFHTVLKLPVMLCVAATLPVSAALAWGVLRFYEKPVKRWMINAYSTRRPSFTAVEGVAR